MKVNIIELNKLLKEAFWRECSLVGSFDTSYRIEFPSKLTVDEFIEFADDSKEFLSQFGIDTGAIIAATPEESNKIFTIQINKLPTIEKYTEKFDALTKAVQLHAAANNGEVESVKMLLEGGADVNSKNIVGETPVQVAARMGHDGIIDILLERGASINSTNNSGETALHIVAQTNHVSTLERLLATPEIDVHSKDREGNTALHLAARVGNQDVMNKLLQAGIDIESTNNQGETPLFSAAYAVNTSAVEFLLNKGVKINHQDNGGATALHIVVNDEYGFAMVKILLNNEADVTIKTHKGVTALQIADQETDAEMGEVLIDALLNKAPKTEKPDFKLQELSDYWDEQIKKLADKPVSQTVAEGATGGAEGVLGVQRLRNLINFFSPATSIQPANSTDADESQDEKEPAVNLGR
jgi:ankyrin repeat protein